MQTNQQINPRAAANYHRHVRVGKKTIASSRVDHALQSRLAKLGGDSKPKTAAQSRVARARRAVSLYRPTRLHIAAACMSLTLIVAGGVSYAFYQKEQQKVADRQKTQQLASARVASEKAASCRAEKARQKADLIGKLTFAELYDNDACNR